MPIVLEGGRPATHSKPPDCEKECVKKGEKEKRGLKRETGFSLLNSDALVVRGWGI